MIGTATIEALYHGGWSLFQEGLDEDEAVAYAEALVAEQGLDLRVLVDGDLVWPEPPAPPPEPRLVLLRQGDMALSSEEAWPGDVAGALDEAKRRTAREGRGWQVYRVAPSGGWALQGRVEPEAAGTPVVPAGRDVSQATRATKKARATAEKPAPQGALFGG